MDLKQIRIKNRLTQAKAADFLHVSLRSYKYYENDETKKDTLKYNYMCEKLSKCNLVDEAHGVLSLDEIKSSLKEIFDRYNINFCYLFGSYAKKTATPRSDVNILIDSNLSGLDQFSILEDLKSALLKKVDVVDLKDLGYKQDLLKEILKNGIKIYDK